MVFCGKPSKACQRCRARRLRCDHLKTSCTPCLRANVPCTGYRDTSALRIRNESQSVQRRQQQQEARTRAHHSEQSSFPKPAISSPVVPPFTPYDDLLAQARESLFVARIQGGQGEGWDFLAPLFDDEALLDSRAAQHVKLSIDAVSLAHLSRQDGHQASSPSPLNFLARERYVAALQATSRALQSKSRENITEAKSIITATLLLDLFEKVSNDSTPSNGSWIDHMNGGLALVQLRGLQNFKDPSDIQLLVRLSMNVVFSCIASDKPVPSEVMDIREHVERHVGRDEGRFEDPKWRAMGLMIEYTALRANIRSGLVPLSKLLHQAVDLDRRTEMLLEPDSIPEPWGFKRILLDSDRKESLSDVYGDHYDVYLDRHVTQTWNIMRIARILINEFILEHSSSDNDLARSNLQNLASDICASVPQYTNCAITPGEHPSKPASSTASSNSSSSSVSPILPTAHSHFTTQGQDIYTLIFPLYVAGWPQASGQLLRTWIVDQLHHMSEQFGVRKSQVVANLLEAGIIDEQNKVHPWTIYALLGSYAFAAC